MSEKVTIFDKQYGIKDLRKIVLKNDDPVLEYLGEQLDYICDCSTVPFFEDYRVMFRNRETGQQVDVYIKYHPDDKSKEFVDGQNSVYYQKVK